MADVTESPEAKAVREIRAKFLDRRPDGTLRVKAGTRLRASDRRYEVMPDGSWRRIKDLK